LSVRFKLIVGLGNPTPQYEKTRHNAGFWFLDEIAARNRTAFTVDSRTRGLLASFEVEGDRIYLLKPMEYMNRSGSAVASIARFYKFETPQILVAHDELDFQPGVVKFKNGGGHGGHNGLRDIVAQLGSPDFSRLRIGIGRPASREAGVDYVLGKPSQSDLTLIRSALDRSADLFPDMLSGNLDRVINSLHAG
jgi:peptidyl-tRNA hydrolase, PTH1 family